MTMRFDVLAYILNDTSARIGDAPMKALLKSSPALLDQRLAEAGARLLHGVPIITDQGEGAFDSVVFPTAAEVQSEARSGGPVLPVEMEVELKGKLSAHVHSVSFRFPEVLDQIVLSVERPKEDVFSEPLEAGIASSSLPVRLNNSKVTTRAEPEAPGSPGSPNVFRLTLDFLAMGFRHILPDGVDHILFVVGLVLLNPRRRPLVLQVSAFTVAHSITLGLSVYGVLRLPPSVVEPLIALSIAFIAIENLCTAELKPWRAAVVFGFGLVHGLGFAAALNSLGLARRNFLTALVGFNGGVEFGQLSVVAVALIALRAFHDRAYYRRAIAIPASGAIAVVALVWAVQRMFAFA